MLMCQSIFKIGLRARTETKTPVNAVKVNIEVRLLTMYFKRNLRCDFFTYKISFLCIYVTSPARESVQNAKT